MARCEPDRSPCQDEMRDAARRIADANRYALRIVALALAVERGAIQAIGADLAFLMGQFGGVFAGQRFNATEV